MPSHIQEQLCRSVLPSYFQPITGRELLTACLWAGSTPIRVVVQTSNGEVGKPCCLEERMCSELGWISCVFARKMQSPCLLRNLVLFGFISFTSAYLNLYLSTQETYRLLGKSACFVVRGSPSWSSFSTSWWNWTRKSKSSGAVRQRW